MGLFFCSPPEIARSTISMLTSPENKKLEKSSSKEFEIEQKTPATSQSAVFLDDNKKTLQQEDALVNNLALYFVSLARKLNQPKQ